MSELRFDSVPFQAGVALAYANRSEDEQIKEAAQEMAPLAVQLFPQLADNRVQFWIVVGVVALWLFGSGKKGAWRF